MKILVENLRYLKEASNLRKVVLVFVILRLGIKLCMSKNFWNIQTKNVNMNSCWISQYERYMELATEEPWLAYLLGESSMSRILLLTLKLWWRDDLQVVGVLIMPMSGLGLSVNLRFGITLFERTSFIRNTPLNLSRVSLMLQSPVMHHPFRIITRVK